MSALWILALTLWLALTAASGVIWWRIERSSSKVLQRRRSALLVLGVEVLVTGAVAAMLATAAPTSAPWTWAGVGVAAVAAVSSGGVVALAVLALADSTPGGARAGPTVLRGGAWIGALERVGLVGSILAGSTEGIVAIIAIKSLARYPELKTGQSTGASERFIIGTFASLGWAALCAGMATLLA